jgi:hypothetical protein
MSSKLSPRDSSTSLGMTAICFVIVIRLPRRSGAKAGASSFALRLAFQYFALKFFYA